MSKSDIEIGDLVEWSVKYNLEWYGKYGIVVDILSEDDVRVIWLNDMKMFKLEIHRASSLKMISRLLKSKSSVGQ